MRLIYEVSEFLSIVACCYHRVYGSITGRTANAAAASAVTVCSSPRDVQGVRNICWDGRLVDVRVFGQPDLNATAEVDSEGNISSCISRAPVRARCRTEKDVQRTSRSLLKVFKVTQVSGRITERRAASPRPILVRCGQPTRIQMMRKVRLNEVMLPRRIH